MSVQKVVKGSFDFKPNKWVPLFAFDRIGYVTVFHENCNYDYQDAGQQKDWLKLGGVAFALFPWDKHSNTAMVGFRYNPTLNVMELIDYTHINGVTDRGIGRTPIATVALGEKFVWWVRADAKKKIVSINIATRNNGIVSIVRDFPQLSTGICWPVGGYAGGDVKAVQDMSFTEEKVFEWGEKGPTIIRTIFPELWT